MAWVNQDFSDGDYLPGSQLNELEDDVQDDIYRVEGLKAGSFVFFRDANNFIKSGNFFNNTASGTTAGSLVFFRDANDFIKSGNVYIEGKNVAFTNYRDGNNFVISGEVTVT